MKNALTAFAKLVSSFLAMLGMIIFLVAIVYVSYQQGRRDHHKDLLNELEAKGGAPVLVYPPDAMFEYPED